MSSSQKPGAVQKRGPSSQRAAARPASSASSRSAVAIGGSSGSSVPAGISSSTSPVAWRHWRTIASRSPSQARMATAPGCSITSRVVRCPSERSTSSTRTRTLRPLHGWLLESVRSSIGLIVGDRGPASIRGATPIVPMGDPARSRLACAASHERSDLQHLAPSAADGAHHPRHRDRRLRAHRDGGAGGEAERARRRWRRVLPHAHLRLRRGRRLRFPGQRATDHPRPGRRDRRAGGRRARDPGAPDTARSGAGRRIRYPRAADRNRAGDLVRRPGRPARRRRPLPGSRGGAGDGHRRRPRRAVRPAGGRHVHDARP